jgi:hypothetical protein
MNVVGDGYLEITMAQRELHKLPVGATINQAHTATVLTAPRSSPKVSLRRDLLLGTASRRTDRSPGYHQDDHVEVDATTAPLAENYLRPDAWRLRVLLQHLLLSIQMRINGLGCPGSSAAITP